MNIHNLENLLLSIKIDGSEFVSYIKSEIGNDLNENWTDQDIRDYIYEDLKDFLKSKIGNWTYDIKITWKNEGGLRKTQTHHGYLLYFGNKYSNNLWAIKKELGLSNKKLEQMTGISYGSIARMERGDQDISPCYKDLIEKATGYEVEIY